MKQFIAFSLLLSLFVVQHAAAQNAALDLPVSSLVPHYRLFVTYNTTTILLFPAAVRPVDRGDRDLIVQKQPGVENVLKLKAARRGFPPTNLHVFAGNGLVYAFDIYYTDSLATTHNLGGILPSSPVAGPPVLFFSNNLPNSDRMDSCITAVKAFSPSRIASTHHDRMKLSLQSIGFGDGIFFFRLKIVNRSMLDYRVDFTRLYIRDLQRAKRSSVQNQEVSSIYEDSTRIIPGGSRLVHVLAIPAFTLAKHKEFLLEVYEKNGGRALSLRLSNKDLFKVQKL